MSREKQLKRQDQTVPQTSTTACPPAQSVGLDELDVLPYITLPELIRKGSEESLSMATTALYHEGGRGAAARRLLAREVQLSRSQLRYRQTLLNFEIEKFFKGGGDLERIRLSEELVATEHSRMMTSLDRLAKLDSGMTPNVRVSAQFAQVNVNEDKSR